MALIADREFLAGWPTECAQCGQSCFESIGVIKLSDNRVMHGACYRLSLPKFGEFLERQSMSCLACRQPCDGSEEVVQLAVGHAMHVPCYEKWLADQDDELLRVRSQRFRTTPTAIVSNEVGMSREQVRQHRYAKLFPSPRELRTRIVVRARPPASSCNDGASADAEGEDSRLGQVDMKPAQLDSG
jgi:hypothetical protein